jgi:hypothetical protein
MSKKTPCIMSDLFTLLILWVLQAKLLQHTWTGAPVCVVPVLQWLRRCIVALLGDTKQNLIFQYISNKMRRFTVYLYLETALHVSGCTSTHHQERKQLSTVCFTIQLIHYLHFKTHSF